MTKEEKERLEELNSSFNVGQCANEYLTLVKKAITDKEEALLVGLHPYESLISVALNTLQKDDILYIMNLNPYAFGGIKDAPTLVHLLAMPWIPDAIIVKLLCDPVYLMKVEEVQLSKELQKRLLNIIKSFLEKTGIDSWYKFSNTVALLGLLDREFLSDEELAYLVRNSISNTQYLIYSGTRLSNAKPDVRSLFFQPEIILKLKKKGYRIIKNLSYTMVIKVLTHPAFKSSTNEIKAAFITKVPIIWEFQEQAIQILEALSKLSYSTCSEFIQRNEPVKIPSEILEKLRPKVISKLVKQQEGCPLLYVMDPNIVKTKLAGEIVANPEFATAFSQVMNEQELKYSPLSVFNLLLKLANKLRKESREDREIIKWGLSSRVLNDDEKAAIIEILLTLNRGQISFSRGATELENQFNADKQALIKFVQEMIGLQI